MKIIFAYSMFLFAFLGQAQTEPTWTTIHRFSGNGIEDTEDFIVPQSKWRLVWKANKQYTDVYGGNLIVFLIDKDSEEKLLVNALTPSSGQTILRMKGKFYFKVQSVLTNWMLEVQVQERQQ